MIGKDEGQDRREQQKDRQQMFVPDAPARKDAPIEVNANSLMKYVQYTQFESDGVWEQRPGERVRLEHYMDKCFDTTLVAMADDFVPSRAFYSGYLMDYSTFSFSPSHESIRLYQVRKIYIFSSLLKNKMFFPGCTT